MAIFTAQPTVGTTATPISPSSGGSLYGTFGVYVPAGTDIYVGDATVTTGTGFKVPAGSFYRDQLNGEALFAVAASPVAVFTITNSD